jgi:hypothetical protein
MSWSGGPLNWTMKTMQAPQTPALDREPSPPADKVYRIIDVSAPSPLSTPILTPESRARQIRTSILGLFPGLTNTATMTTRLALVAVGFVPVTLIAASTFEIVSLRALAVLVLLPAAFLAAVIMNRHRWAGRLVARAMLVGVLATGMYDLVRFGFIWAELMHVDPIPHIGVDLHLSPAWIAGYLWRYGLNGAGLSIAFFSLGLSRVRDGLLFGFFVAAGLIGVLLISPHADEVLWHLDAISVTMIICGHLAFGAGLAIVQRALHHD